MVTRARIALWTLAYAALLAHLLFIPDAFSPLPSDETLRRLAHMPWLRLGSDQNVALVSRCDNAVPLGPLLAAWAAPLAARRSELPTLLVAGLLGCLWAMDVNLAQIWLPSRTVSLNNLVAELLGVIGGGLLWNIRSTGLRSWWLLHDHPPSALDVLSRVTRPSPRRDADAAAAIACPGIR